MSTSFDAEHGVGGVFTVEHRETDIFSCFLGAVSAFTLATGSQQCARASFFWLQLVIYYATSFYFLVFLWFAGGEKGPKFVVRYIPRHSLLRTLAAKLLAVPLSLDLFRNFDFFSFVMSEYE